MREVIQVDSGWFSSLHVLRTALQTVIEAVRELAERADSQAGPLRLAHWFATAAGVVEPDQGPENDALLMPTWAGE